LAVIRGFCQVLCLLRVGFKVVKLFVAEIDIASVLETGGAEGLGFWDCFVVEEVLVEEIGPPVCPFSFQEWQQAPALHLLRDREVGELENCGGDIYIEGEFVAD